MLRALVLREIARLAGVAAAGGVLGQIVGEPLPGSWLALLAYALWHLSQAARMAVWLAGDPARPPPEGGGMWSVLFDALYRHQRVAAREWEAMLAQTRYLREAAMSVPDAVVMVDQSGAIVWGNPRARELLGVDHRQDTGRLLNNLLRDPDFVRYLQRGEFGEPLELPSPRKAGMMLQFEIHGFGNGNRLLFARDVTKLKRLEQMRVDFIANVSHELRTPLTVVSGYLEMLRDVDEPRRVAVLERVLPQLLSQTARMEALVSDLTMLSRLESLPTPQQLQQIDVQALVDRLVSDVACTVGMGKTITVAVDANRALLGQESEIHSAFGNLINNACKYSGKAGAVAVAWRVEKRRAVFEVSDDGEGIDAEHIPRLTERFYRVDSSRSQATGGTGLGLAIVKHVLMRHQGMLEITSERGRGSTFRCVFPLSRVSAVASPAERRSC